MAIAASNVALAIILAGARREADPLLDATKVKHKGLLDINGQPMIGRVASALCDAGLGKRLIVTAERRLRDEFANALERIITVEFQDPAESPACTFQQVIERYKSENGFLVTTCDHALLSADVLHSFLNGIDPAVDVAAAIVEEATFREAFPDARRTFIRLKDGAFSGANLFWVHPARAGPLFAFWRKLELNRKKPWKMANAIGVTTAVKYLAGALDGKSLIAAIKRKTGVNGQLVAVPFATAAIDVDKPADLELVRSIINKSA